MTLRLRIVRRQVVLLAIVLALVLTVAVPAALAQTASPATITRIMTIVPRIFLLMLISFSKNIVDYRGATVCAPNYRKVGDCASVSWRVLQMDTE